LNSDTSHAEFKKQNVSNVMGPTNLNTTDITLDAAKIIVRPTLQGWKLNRVNYTLIPSNVLTAKRITRLTLTFVFSITNTILEI